MEFNFTGDWDKVFKMLDPTVFKQIARLGLQKIAAFYEGKIKENIVSGGQLAGKPFLENAPSTINAKGSSKPLIAKGELVANVKAYEVSNNTFFVGVKRGNARTKEGRDYADIAATHEWGAIVPTKSGIRFTVPPRPFMGPVLEKFKGDALKIFRTTMLGWLK
mgnify:CR=1 FL=1